MISSDKKTILVIGAGIAGLTIGYRLAQHDFNPIVVEKATHVGNGSTTRNQGWLHAGALHSQAIKDEQSAMNVAKRCQKGMEEFLRFCPESVEDVLMPSIATTLDTSNIGFIQERWKSAGVHFQDLPKSQLEQIATNIHTDDIAAAWRVQDSMVDTRLICSKLVANIRNLGGEVQFNTEVTSVVDGNVTLTQEQNIREFTPEIIVVAAGYGTNHVLDANWQTQIPVRYWKSHLLISPKLTNANLFCLDSDEVSFVQHGEATVIGMTQDHLECSIPNLQVVPEQVEKMKLKVRKRIKSSISNNQIAPIACIKVDIADDKSKARNLDVEIIQIAPKVLCALPGKMTEAPALADLILRYAYTEMDSICASSRPLDDFLSEINC